MFVLIGQLQLHVSLEPAQQVRVNGVTKNTGTAIGSLNLLGGVLGRRERGSKGGGEEVREGGREGREGGRERERERERKRESERESSGEKVSWRVGKDEN